mgnify:CR=1 FL=1
MGTVSAGATMSLDGYIGGPEDSGFELLFKWYGAGDVEVPMPHKSPGVPDSRVSAATAAVASGNLVSSASSCPPIEDLNSRMPLPIASKRALGG